MNKFCFFVRLSGIFLFMSTASRAELPPELQNSLNQIIAAQSALPIYTLEDQSKAIKGAVSEIHARIFDLPLLPPDRVSWMRALTLLSDRSPLTVSFSFRVVEEMRNELLEFLKCRFPVQLKSSVVGEGRVDSEFVERAPRIGTAQLFSEILIEEIYEGWTVFGLEKVSLMRGAAGYDNMGFEVKAGESSNSQSMLALTDPLIAQTPLYLVNEEPIALTDSTESQIFFEALPIETKAQTALGWVGYRYFFSRLFD